MSAIRRLSYSSLSTYLNCRRRYYWQYDRQIELSREKEDQLFLGSAVHEMLAAWFSAVLDSTPTAPRMNPQIVVAPPDISPEARKIWNHAAAIMDGYQRRYPVEAHIIRAVEYEWALPVITPSGSLSAAFQLSGKIDLLTEDPATGAWWIWDHKTRSRDMDGGAIDRLPLDLQLHLYAWGMERYTGHSVAGVVYDVIQKATIRQKQGGAKVKGGGVTPPESDEEFSARLAECYLSAGETPADAPYQRYDLVLDRANNKSLIAEVFSVIAEITAAGDRIARYPRNTARCEDYHSRCPYWAICSAGDGQGDPMVIENFYRPVQEAQGSLGQPKVSAAECPVPECPVNNPSPQPALDW